ncbi:MAG: FAD-dependent monooxygenase [Sphingomicrobium sp.]
MGAGPVGLVTALRLDAFGIPCVVVEAADEVQEDLRASTFHPPTLDMLDEYGLAAPLIAQGLITPSWQIRFHESGRHVEFDLSLLREDTAHPYRLQCEQHRLVRLLVERLGKAENVELRFGARLDGIVQDADGVTATVLTDGGSERLTGRLLVGADGARSTTRDLIGSSFEGETYPETTILAVTHFPFQDHLPNLSNVNYIWSDHGTFSLLRLRDFWRCSLYPDQGESIEEALQPGAIEAKLQRIVARSVPYEVAECRSYRVHKRIVSDYRHGRVALAGDAAHINSPSGGMGMNGGIHDAFALTSAIAEIWQGDGLDALDRYGAIRRPIAAQEILNQSHRNRSRMQERDPLRREEQFAELEAVVADPVRHRDYLLRSSMIAGLRAAGQLP